MGTARSLRSSSCVSFGISLFALWSAGCDFHPAAQSTSTSEDGGTALTSTGTGGARDGGALGGRSGVGGGASGTGGTPTRPAQCPNRPGCLGRTRQPGPLPAAPSPPAGG